MKVLHLIASLENGGAERMLSELALGSDSSVENKICCIFNREGWYDEILRDNGIEIIKFEWSLLRIPSNIIKMIKLFKENDVVQCWLYYAMFLGMIVGILSNRKIIWNIRQSAIEKEYLKPQIFFLVRFLKYFSWYPSAIISCSERTLQKHQSIGYSAKNMIWIPNFTSYELSENEEINISEKYDSEIYLCVGRKNTIKNHENLVLAFNEFLKENKNAELWIVGYLNKSENKNIKYFDKTKNLSDHYRKAKYCISSSLSEGFPNVIIESMIYGTPVITTDAGDSFKIIENSGINIEGFDALSILDSLKKSVLIDQAKYSFLSRKSTEIVSNKYNAIKIKEEYEKTYRKVVGYNVN